MNVGFLGRVKLIKFRKVNPLTEMKTPDIEISDRETISKIVAQLKSAQTCSRLIEPQTLRFTILIPWKKGKEYAITLIFERYLFTEKNVHCTPTTELWEELENACRDVPMEPIEVESPEELARI
jgi:hypothetical protein